jgi:L-cysteine S-thiosulfotransferase
MKAGHWIGVMAGLAALAAGAALAQAPQEVTDDHLVPYRIEEGAVPRSLTGKPGDPATGKQIVADRGVGNCLSCHAMPMPEQADYGNIGPDLAGVGGRLSEEQIRLRVINPKLTNPATAMPAFYRVEGLVQVAEPFAGKPILTAEQVEDVVAYLTTLK